MLGTRGKRSEPETGDAEQNTTPSKNDDHNQASKKDIKRTQKLVTELDEKINGLNSTLENVTEQLAKL